MSTHSTSKSKFLSPGPVFPPEITDCIIHELSPDLPVLRLCSLVCRSWIPASRYILHETLSLRGEDIPDFLDIIAPSENTYLDTLRAIDIGFCENGPAASMLQLLPQFLSLKTIRIHSSIFYHRFPVIPRITTLEFFDTHFRSFAAFTDLTSQCPDLKNLKFRNIAWQSLDGWAPTGPDIISAKMSSRLELDTLSADISNDPHLLDWLSSPETGPLTSDLTLILPKMRRYVLQDPLTDETVGKVRQYCHNLNVRLTNLYVQFGSTRQFERLDFSKNTALQSIRLTIVSNKGDEATDLFAKLPDILQQFRLCNHLEELILDVQDASLFEVATPLKRLGAVLVTPPFSRIRQLQFNGPWGSDADPDITRRKLFKEAVLENLPASFSHRIVLFDPCA
ncbi:hypothetical protein B0H11DRAFT_2274750 [Mycena galericulata]|nr:hypothetical protein B0H11DRAFT_2274750 [Mycena galericulata]